MRSESLGKKNTNHAALTAWVALFKHGRLRRDEIVLVHGSGGVSLFGVQLANAHGARVIATSRSEKKIALLRELGAADVIDTTKNSGWEKEVMRLTQNQGVNHVLEVVGGANVQRSISASAVEGHIALIGFLESQMTSIAVPTVLGKALRIQSRFR